MTTFDPNIVASTRSKKGQPSPNPGGRPRTQALSDALRQRLGETNEDDPQERTYAEIIAANLIQIASGQGRSAVAVAAEIADRIEGRVTGKSRISDQLRAFHRDDLQTGGEVSHGDNQL